MPKLTRLFRIRLVGPLIALVVTLTGVSMFGGVRDQSNPPASGVELQVELQSVSTQRLALVGITLSPPAAIDLAAAIPPAVAVAATLSDGSDTRETVLVRLDDEGPVPPLVDRLVWVISRDTEGLAAGAGPFPGYASPRPLDWSLSFVDALTGEYLGTIEGSGR